MIFCDGQICSNITGHEAFVVFQVGVVSRYVLVLAGRGGIALYHNGTELLSAGAMPGGVGNNAAARKKSKHGSKTHEHASDVSTANMQQTPKHTTKHKDTEQQLPNNSYRTTTQPSDTNNKTANNIASRVRRNSPVSDLLVLSMTVFAAMGRKQKSQAFWKRRIAVPPGQPESSQRLHACGGVPPRTRNVPHPHRPLPARRR